MRRTRPPRRAPIPVRVVPVDVKTMKLPQTSGPNRILSSVSSTDASAAQTSSALADVNGTLASTGVYVGADPADPHTYLGGITRSGSFVTMHESVGGDWSLDGVSGSLQACRIGQIVFVRMSLQASESVGPRFNFAVAPPPCRPPTEVDVVAAVCSPSGTTVTPQILTIFPDGRVNISGDIPPLSNLVATFTYAL